MINNNILECLRTVLIKREYDKLNQILANDVLFESYSTNTRIKGIEKIKKYFLNIENKKDDYSATSEFNIIELNDKKYIEVIVDFPNNNQYISISLNEEGLIKQIIAEDKEDHIYKVIN